MPEHNYIAERRGRKTYLKGNFTGRFIGRLDPYQSDARHERFYNIEVTDGKITTRQDQVTLWHTGTEDPEFANESAFHVKLPGEINVDLQYLDGSFKHFKVKVKQMKLLRCGLFDKTYHRDEMYGTIRGDVSGYVLHHDTVAGEVLDYTPGTIDPDTGPGMGSGPVIEPPGRVKSFNLWNLALASSVCLLIAALAVSENVFFVLLLFLLGGLTVGWLYRGLNGKLAARSGQLAAILLYCALFAFGLGWMLSHATGGRTREQLILLERKAEALLAGRNYQQALPVFDSLLADNGSDPDYLYKRALCYVGLDNIRKAVADLKPGFDNGDTAAVRLYNFINPLKKRQVGTQIRCRDSTISHSRHRQGTCSYHGGVLNWEEPVYKEYREY